MKIHVELDPRLIVAASIALRDHAINIARDVLDIEGDDPVAEKLREFYVNEYERARGTSVEFDEQFPGLTQYDFTAIDEQVRGE